MTIADTIKYKGYTIEIHYDEDAGNPLKEYDDLLTIVLHEKAEDHFGWTTDKDYANLLQTGLDELLRRGFTRNLYGERGALTTVVRWLKAFHGVTVALPISAIEHSGTAVYLGAGAALGDPGGWDSGWIGLAIDTPARRKVMGFDGEGAEKFGTNPDGDRWDSPAAIETALRQDFKTFQSWVAGECYGYIVKDPEGNDVDSCFGYYGERDYVITEAKYAADSDLEDRGADQAEIDENMTAYTVTTADTSAFAFTFTDQYGAVYEPWTDGHSVGFKVTRDTESRYLSISPSIGTDDLEDDTTCAFIREGQTPETDEAYTHFDLFGSKIKES